MDTDGDGKISKEEVLAMHAKADTDGDGLVTREELSRHIMKVRGNAAGRHGPPAAETIFQNFDSNKDGKLSRDEVPAPVWSRLSSVDANDDGSVSKDEYQKAVESRRSGPTKATDAGQ